MVGLAGQGVPQGDPQMIEQVKAMLLQGVTPQELIQQGVPQEVIEAAIAQLQSEQQVQQPQQGLAGTTLPQR